jgi:peptidyl-dipeptidase A
MWRSRYENEELEMEAAILWIDGIYPLYKSLHTYVYNQLKEIYGAKMPNEDKIPAHLLGNMWAQTWVFIGGFLTMNHIYIEIQSTGQSLRSHQAV